MGSIREAPETDTMEKEMSAVALERPKTPECNYSAQIIKFPAARTRRIPAAAGGNGDGPKTPFDALVDRLEEISRDLVTVSEEIQALERGPK